MKITFCLLSPSKIPVGGYKIVYEYANRLSEIGNDVSIVYDCSTFLDKYPMIYPIAFIRKIVAKFSLERRDRWFDINSRVNKVYSLRGINDKSVPNGDCVIATAVMTAPMVEELSDEKGKKFYFVQDIENWDCSDEFLNRTYAMNFRIITISSWIKDRIDKYSLVPAVVIPNGIDLNVFNIKKSIESRNPISVAMLYHTRKHKGSKYGIEALCMLKKDYPELKAVLFGTSIRPDGLPLWIEYIQNANIQQLVSIYNNAAIFLCSTISEGFGLTGAESMACGCALVSTDYLGLREYANNTNSYLCDVKSSESLYLGMKTLIENTDLRILLAHRGAENIAKLDWKESVSKFSQFLKCPDNVQ